MAPFFSPDGQWVGFSAGGKLNKISVEGGAVVPLGDVTTFGGASWGEDGSIIVSDAVGKGLLRIPAGGGPPETVAALAKRRNCPRSPADSARRQSGAVYGWTGALDVDRIHHRGPHAGRSPQEDRGPRRQSPRYLPTSSGAGHLVYVNKATLFAIPFDLDKLETRGTAVPVLDDVAYQAQPGPVNLTSPARALWSTAGPAAARPQ